MNDRLLRLFHAGYVDRPRAQLDYYPTSGSMPFIYALADQGVRLLTEHDSANFSNYEWSRKNREVGRPFIEHQIAIMDFYVSLQLAVRNHPDLSFLHADDLMAQGPPHLSVKNVPFSFRVQLRKDGNTQDVGVVPDLVFGLRFSDGSRRCFLVEVDRGTMPVARSDIRQTSFARKMEGYLAAFRAKLHERDFGWKSFRVLTVTTDDLRLRSMQEELRTNHSSGAILFFFASRQKFTSSSPLGPIWQDGLGRIAVLV